MAKTKTDEETGRKVAAEPEAEAVAFDEDGNPVEEPPEPTGDDSEDLPLILVGAWVRLKSDETVPEDLWGRLAAVVEAQVFVDSGLDTEGRPRKDARSPRPVEYQTEDARFIVRTRDERSEELECTRESFLAVYQNGRHGIEAHG